jgi:hypothetical protein
MRIPIGGIRYTYVCETLCTDTISKERCFISITMATTWAFFDMSVPVMVCVYPPYEMNSVTHWIQLC